jgi:hypothetical protein
MNFNDFKYLLPGWKNEERKGIAAYKIGCALAKDLFDNLMCSGRSDLARTLAVEPNSYTRFAGALLASCVFEACRCSATSSEDEFWAVFYFARRQAWAERRGVDAAFVRLVNWIQSNSDRWKAGTSDVNLRWLIGDWVLTEGVPKNVEVERKALAQHIGDKICDALALWAQAVLFSGS